jgi:streptomycin 6-kinase
MDEWNSGLVLEAFGGSPMVRVFQHMPGAVLLERLDPATPVVEMFKVWGDDEATHTIAGIITRMSSTFIPDGTPTVIDWGQGFSRYRKSGDRRIAPSLVDAAERTYFELCATQRDPRLLHGDLQHDNVLFDARWQWTAIDPKGVVGELAYEVGAALRNPREASLIAPRAAIERRLGIYSEVLGIDQQRLRGWGFAQAVLSAIWSIEDGENVTPGDPSLIVAKTLGPP